MKKMLSLIVVTAVGLYSAGCQTGEGLRRDMIGLLNETGQYTEPAADNCRERSDTNAARQLDYRMDRTERQYRAFSEDK